MRMISVDEQIIERWTTISTLFSVRFPFAGHCRNMSKHYLCHHHADGITIDAERDNMKLNGFFECEKSRCVKIKKPFSCDRYCAKITTAAVNVLIMRDDSLITAECDVGLAYNEARGAQPGIRIDPPKKIWEEKDGILLTNCFDVTRDGDKLRYDDKMNYSTQNNNSRMNMRQEHFRKCILVFRVGVGFMYIWTGTKICAQSP